VRALVVTDFGATPELLDIQRPEPAPGEVRVRVRAASVNGSDKAVAAGYLKKRHDGAPLPGGAGQGLRRRDRCRRRRGRRFCGRGSGVRGGHQAPPERRFLRRVRHRPHLGRAGEAARSIEFAEAASLGLAGAAVASIDAAELTAGHTVLVVGATGGVGGQVVQLAARAGAQVIATADAASEAHVRDLGAAEAIDYTGDVPAATLAAHPGGVDVLVHLAGDPTALLPVVRPGGKFISTLIGSPINCPATP